MSNPTQRPWHAHSAGAWMMHLSRAAATLTRRPTPSSWRAWRTWRACCALMTLLGGLGILAVPALHAAPPAATAPNTNSIAQNTTAPATTVPTTTAATSTLPQVEVLRLRAQDVPRIKHYRGYTRPETHFPLRAEMEGRVRKVHFETGDRVSAARLLLSIEAGTRKANLKQAQADFELAAAEYAREAELAQQNAAAQANLDDLAAARTQQELRVALYRLQLARSQVRAPLSGWILKRMVNPGDFVDRGQLLAEIVQLETLLFRVYVPARDVSQLRLGQEARIALDAQTPSGTTSHRGVIDWIAPLSEQRQGSFAVDVQLPNPQTQLRGGLSGKAALTLEVLPQRIVVPRQLLIRRLKGFVVRLHVAGKMTLQEVTLERNIGKWAVLSQGLSDGAEIITAGPLNIRADSTVEVSHTQAQPLLSRSDFDASSQE